MEEKPMRAMWSFPKYFYRSRRQLSMLRIYSRFYAANSQSNANILKIKQMIEDNTCVSRDSLTPEIALHLITPSCLLWNVPEEQIPFKDPFWAFYWPGGQALARYILDNSDLVQSKSILDIGSGCGATAIAAAMSNALRVTANDIDPVAACAISLNGVLNNVKITVSTEQMIGNCEDVYDTVFVGDMFYDDQFADILMKWLKLLRKKGKNILVGDPGRVPFKKYEHCFQGLIKYHLDTDNISPGFSQVSVWEML